MKTIMSVCTVVVLTATVVAAQGASLSRIQERMKERVSSIAALKAAQVVGENRKGYLEIVTLPADADTEIRGMTSADIRQLVEAENHDRKQVYTALSEKVGVSPMQVGKARAKQIYEDAKSYVLLKNKSGDWVKKVNYRNEEQ